MTSSKKKLYLLKIQILEVIYNTYYIIVRVVTNNEFKVSPPLFIPWVSDEAIRGTK